MAKGSRARGRAARVVPLAGVAAAVALLAGCPTHDDPACKLGAQETTLRAWIDDTYLWYSEVPAVDPASYSSPQPYFMALKTPATTASGAAKDRFHFFLPTAEWDAMSQSGVQAGYGIQFIVLAGLPPREVVVAYLDPAAPAGNRVVARGAHVLTVDGVDLVNANTQAAVNALNAGLFPSGPGQTHTLGVQDVGSTVTRTVQLVSANVTTTPVQSVHVIPSTTVGYALFNDHYATAEAQLAAAISSLQAAGATDLVLDLRYNGGGYLVIASELAYMIAGPTAASGQTFEMLSFNDKHPITDPITGQTITAIPFQSTAVGLTVQKDTPLPHLDLPRVVVLTGPGTCSASESVMNSLRGIGVDVMQVGSTTCGKPYGFYPKDLCGTTYFAIQFKGVNAAGFGDYGDGFVPGGDPALYGLAALPGCPVGDDFTHALGDPAEARLAAALQVLSSGTCPAPLAARTTSAASGPVDDTGAVLPRSPWRENRILGP